MLSEIYCLQFSIEIFFQYAKMMYKEISDKDRVRITMESFVFAVSTVLPIIIMVAIGYVIKKIGLVGEDFAKTVNKLVFRIFLPVMLFLNIYSMDSIADMDLGYIGYAVAAVLVIFFVSIPLVMLITKKNDRRGPLLQAGFRSNYALVGIPLVESLGVSAAGLASATLLSAVSIPLFNMLAVISLSVFSGGGEKPSFRKIILGIIKNPLIQGIFAGLCVVALRGLFVQYNIEFRLSDIAPLYKVLTYLSNLATPLALLMLGIQFDFSTVKELRRELIFGMVMRTAAVPLLGIGVAYLCFRDSFGGAEFAALVALFSTPVAVSSVPMAQEMGADHTLAGQLVVWSTPLSAVTVFVATLLLKMAGVF